MASGISRRARAIRRSIIGILGAATIIAGGVAFAGHYGLSLEGSQFEIESDANLVKDSLPLSSFDDWATVDEMRRDDLDSGQTDDSFGQGSKEDTQVPSVVAGSIPPNKSDLKSFGIYVEDTGVDKFLHLFWSRVQDPSGTTNMDFEFNQSSTTSANGVTPVRTSGDLLVVYELAKGGSVPQLFLLEWLDGTGGATKNDCDAANSLPCWGNRLDLTSSGDATGSINSSTISNLNSDGLGQLDPRTFGEASIDLDLVFDDTKCTSFGSAYLKSRSSDSFTSALKDFIAPQSVNISNCGSVTIVKNTVPSTIDATFDFTKSFDTDPSTMSSFSLTTVGGTESRTFSNVLAGTGYTVTELAAPTGWTLTDVTCVSSASQSITPVGATATFDVAVGEAITCTYENTAKGKIKVDKVTDPSGDSAVFDFDASWLGANPGGGESDFTLTDASTLFDSGDLTPGTYSVGELAKTGWDLTNTACVSSNSDTETTGNISLQAGETVTCTFTNTKRVDIDILKTDDAGNPLQGVTFSLLNDLAPLGGSAPGVEDTDTGVNCVTNSNGLCSFDNLVPGSYWVVEDSPPAGYDGADPQAVTMAAGDDDVTVELTFVNDRLHKVIVLVCHMGTDDLVTSDVTLGNTTIVTIGDVPVELVGVVTEAELCGLDGFENLDHGETSITIDVGRVNGAVIL